MMPYDFCVYCYWILIPKDWMDIRDVCGGEQLFARDCFWENVLKNSLSKLRDAIAHASIAHVHFVVMWRSTCAHIHIHIHIHIYIYIYLFIYICIYTYTHICHKYGYKCVCSSGMVWTVKMKFMYCCMGHMNDVKGIGWLFSIDLQQMFGGSSYWPPVVWWFYGIAIQHAVLQIVILIKMYNNQNNNNHHHEQQQQHQEHCHHHVYIIHVYIYIYNYIYIYICICNVL